MNPLLSLIIRSMAGKALQRAPEGSALNFVGNQMQQYDPISGIMDLARNVPAIDRGLNSLRDVLGPAEYGTSQATFESLSEPQQEYAMNLYQPGGILEGYNPVSAYGLGTLGTLQARENYMLDRAAAGKPYSETNLAKVQEAIQQLDSGSSDSGPSDSGGYGATGGEGPGAVSSFGMMGGGV